MLLLLAMVSMQVSQGVSSYTCDSAKDGQGLLVVSHAILQLSHGLTSGWLRSLSCSKSSSHAKLVMVSVQVCQGLRST